MTRKLERVYSVSSHLLSPAVPSRGFRPRAESLLRCYDCQCPIYDQIVWLGESYDDGPFEFPFHSHCADQPWPLYETRREFVYPVDKSVLLLDTHAWPAHRFTPVADQLIVTATLYPPPTWLTRTLRAV